MTGISKQTELVDSLASTIQKKIILPTEENISLLQSETNQLEKRLSLLEETTQTLTAAHNRIKLTVSISLLGLAILAVITLLSASGFFS